MKCTHYRKWIYLWEELEAGEQQDVLAHVTSCQACRHCYQQRQQERMILKAAFTAPPADDTLIVTNIMNAIAQQAHNRIAVIDQIFQFLQYPPLRYTLGMLSLLIIAFFFAEFYRVPAPVASIHYDTPLTKTVEMNTAFYEELKRTQSAGVQKESVSTVRSFYACIKACKNSAGADCSACKTKYAKWKPYEDM